MRLRVLGEVGGGVRGARGGAGARGREKRKGTVVGGWGTERKGTVSPSGPAACRGPRVCGVNGASEAHGSELRSFQRIGRRNNGVRGAQA